MGIFKQGTLEVPTSPSPSPMPSLPTDGIPAVEREKSGSVPSITNPPEAPPGPPGTASVDVALIRKALVDRALLDVGERETNGKNRSPMIDEVNRAIGAEMGSPYCISGLCIRVIKPTCDALKLKIPFKLTASSQEFFNQADQKYVSKSGLKGDIGILRVKSDHAHGHAFILKDDQDLQTGICKTIEYNTNASGSRDGEGVYESSRDLSEKHMSGSSFEFRGFVRVAEWVKPSGTPRTRLSWESDDHPERQAWSDRLTFQVESWFPSLEKAQDVRQILGLGYDSFARVERVRMFSELFVAMAYLESSFNPKAVYHEPAPLNQDSIGLFQLSYGDEKNYKLKMALDPKSDDLKDPLKNIDLAVAIFAQLILKDRVITSAMNEGAARYWSCLRPLRKLPDIRERLKKLSIG